MKLQKASASLNSARAARAARAAVGMSGGGWQRKEDEALDGDSDEEDVDDDDDAEVDATGVSSRSRRSQRSGGGGGRVTAVAAASALELLRLRQALGSLYALNFALCGLCPPMSLIKQRADRHDRPLTRPQAVSASASSSASSSASESVFQSGEGIEVTGVRKKGGEFSADRSESEFIDRDKKIGPSTDSSEELSCVVCSSVTGVHR